MKMVSAILLLSLDWFAT